MKLPAWLTEPSPWIFYPVLAAAMIVTYVLAANKTQALVWDGVFIVAGIFGALARKHKS